MFYNWFAIETLKKLILIVKWSFITQVQKSGVEDKSSSGFSTADYTVGLANVHLLLWSQENVIADI